MGEMTTTPVPEGRRGRGRGRGLFCTEVMTAAGEVTVGLGCTSNLTLPGLMPHHNVQLHDQRKVRGVRTGQMFVK